MNKIRYAINMNDFRVAPATDQLFENPNYRQITERTAVLIESGKVDARVVVAQILSRQNPLDYQTLKKQRESLNVKPSTVKKDGEDEGNEVKSTSADTSEGFDVQIGDEKAVSASAESTSTKEAEDESETPDVTKMSLSELRATAMKAGMKGVEIMEKKELIKALSK